MTTRQVRWVPWSVTVAVLVVAIVLPKSLPNQPGAGWPFFLLLTAQALTFATVGVVLVGAQPRNAVSWLFAIVGVFVAPYLVSVLLLRLTLTPLTGRSVLAVAGSTLGVAALFRPLRARIQRTVGRRFFRPRCHAQRTGEAFATRLRDEFGVEARSGDLRAMVHRAMRPSHVSVWLPDPSEPA